ncbi:type II toxin-antitoxin system Phd/YefM family antitoxin [Deinococcota bacterium DY0809b]
MDKQVNVHAAKTHLSRLLEEVLLGEEVVIARGGRPVARLVPLQETPARRTPGTARGKVRMADDFDAPLPEDLAEAFGG